ncbi:MAG: DinB family protein [Bacilli bacterium]
MIAEAADYFALLKAIHQSIDDMTASLTEEQWLRRPQENFNNIAAIIDHVTRVEKRFMAAVAGETMDTDAGAPFKATHWNVGEIRQAWRDVLLYSEAALDKCAETDLVKPGLTLRIGELNRRQLIVYTIAHTTHHRGQIPLVTKQF